MGKELSEMTLEELWELFPIILKEHNTDYTNWYAIEKQRLLNCIDKKDIIRINHIGSSAVEGLISKPTVDILLEIDNESNLEQLTNTLLQDSWILMSSKKIHVCTWRLIKDIQKKALQKKYIICMFTTMITGMNYISETTLWSMKKLLTNMVNLN